MLQMKPGYEIAKRTMDLVLCALAFPFLAPLMALIAVAVKLSSRGPILYRGVRTGRYGATFRILKFRTMVVDAEKIGGGTTALKDPRVFPVGRLLRKYKLDELPQIFNVIAGTMSLVGPRPELPAYTDRYTASERAILAVKPGITDFSSIRFSALDEIVGARDADRVFEEKVLPEKNRLRLEYVAERSLRTDAKILVLTFVRLVRKITG